MFISPDFLQRLEKRADSADRARGRIMLLGLLGGAGIGNILGHVFHDGDTTSDWLKRVAWTVGGGGVGLIGSGLATRSLQDDKPSLEASISDPNLQIYDGYYDPRYDYLRRHYKQ